MKFLRNLNPKNQKNIQPGKFIGSQINLVKMSNEDPRVLNEKYKFKSVNEMKSS